MTVSLSCPSQPSAEENTSVPSSPPSVLRLQSLLSHLMSPEPRVPVLSPLWLLRARRVSRSMSALAQPVSASTGRRSPRAPVRG